MIREVRHLFQKLRLGIHINLKEKYASFMAYTFSQANTEGHFDNRLNFQKHECFNFSQFMSYFLICLHIKCTFGFISFHEVTNCCILTSMGCRKRNVKEIKNLNLM